MIRKLLFLLWITLASAAAAADRTPEDIKASAYELYSRKEIEKSLAEFRAYLERRPADVPARIDFAGVLSEARRHEEAARVLEQVREAQPAHETARFKLGVEYVYLGRNDDAARIFAELQKSANRDLAEAAADASRQLKNAMAREERLKAEQNVFSLADKFAHDQVIAEVNALEKTGPLTFALAMQRLYAMHRLRQYAPALERANALAKVYPAAPDLALMRADLLAQLGRQAEAVAVWRQVEQGHPSTPAARQARDRRHAAESHASASRVYELARQGQHREVVALIDEIERSHPPLAFELELQRLYALAALDQSRRALRIAGGLMQTNAARPDLSLVYADLLAREGKHAEAQDQWKRIVRDFRQTPAAFEAEKHLQVEEARRSASREEARIFELARRNRHRQTVDAINELERKRGALPWVMEMQRLYALQALGDFSRAMVKANTLAEKHPRVPELTLLRAFLLAQTGKKPESKTLLESIRRDHPNTPVAASARQELDAFAAAEEKAPGPEAAIYALASAQKYSETVAAIDRLEQQGPLAFPMQMQRLYALQSLGEWPRAHAEVRKVQEAFPNAPEVALMRADLLARDKQWEDASLILKGIRREHENTPTAAEASRRLDALPPMGNLAKWYWGEAYNSGDYLERFGTLVGSGFVRHGYFIPHARWLQPYAEFRYTVDTRSGAGGRSTVADNFVGTYLGARAQPFAEHYLFFYAQAGLNQDLLDRRDDGDWAYDSQAGVYGFKSWGPGTVLLTLSGEPIRTSGNPANPAEQPSAVQNGVGFGAFWRGDWFVDAGADFSYYHRHSSWIGYGQAHEGFRLFQIGPHAAIDAYLVENVSWDIRGNYFDNLVEAGPGLRLLWVPRRRWEVVLRGEWLNGLYFNRDELDTRGNADSHYDDLRLGLSVGTRW